MNRIKYTTTTTGTGALTVSTVAGFQDLADSRFRQQADGSKFFYMLLDADGTSWEHGVATVSYPSVTRDIILESTNANAALNLSAGTHTMFLTRAGMEGMLVQHTFLVSTPAAIATGSSDSPSFDTETSDGIGAMPGQGDISTDLPFGGSISSILDRVVPSRAVRATMTASFTGNANGGFFGANLSTYFNISKYSNWVPNINGVEVIATVQTPWLGLRKVDNDTAPLQADDLTFSLYNSSSGSITPNVVRLLVEWLL